MSVQFLEKNPFFVLEVAPTDKRSTIISKAEEKAFFLEGNLCDEAQAGLLNPAKRLSAEMDWFCGCDESTISNIYQSIRNKTLISTDELMGLAKLNATLFNFAVSSYEDYFELGYAILDIDEQYGAVTPFELTETFNECHNQAGILTVSEDEVERELSKKREQIRKLISAKTQNLSEDDYIEFVTMLAEKCIADEDYEDGVVIADVIDQYELKMQSDIEAATDEITNHLERIKRIANKEGIEENINGLVRRLKKWDKLVQPLQLKSMTSGVPHKISERVGRDVRELCFWLHNEQEMTEVALLVINAVKDFFTEIASVSNVFDEDARILNNIISENKEVEAITSEIKSIERIIGDWKTQDSDFIGTAAVDDLVARIKNVNRRIKTVGASEETATQMRKILCVIVREGAIVLHNERHRTAVALSIVKGILTEFADIEELRVRLTEDVTTLERQIVNASRPTYRSSDNPQKGTWMAIAFLGLIVIITFICSFCSGNTSSSSSYSGSSNYSGYSSSSSYVPSYNQSSGQTTEKRFSSSVTAGTDVYADIVSIFPSIGIYTEGSSTYTHFVCECETTGGSTVWVYMPTYQYKNYFDSDVSTSVYSSLAEEIIFSDSKRIHGEAKKCNSIMSGLSFDTGATMLIDFESVGS